MKTLKTILNGDLKKHVNLFIKSFKCALKNKRCQKKCLKKVTQVCPQKEKKNCKKKFQILFHPYYHEWCPQV
jgi:hypothetical protein